MNIKWAVLMFVLIISEAICQEDFSFLTPPPEGKSVVYLGRMTGFVGRSRSFHFFDGDKYLIRLKGKNYLRYVCEPGEHLFWVAAESRSFVKIDLKAGRSYALFAKLQAGVWSARAELMVITAQSKHWEEFEGMISKSKTEEINEKYLKKWYKKHPKYIEQALFEWQKSGSPSKIVDSSDYLTRQLANNTLSVSSIEQIFISKTTPFADNTSGDIGLMAPDGSSIRGIKSKCQIDQILPIELANASHLENINIVKTQRIEKAKGVVLLMKIEATHGQLGGGVTGTKSLTVSGKLFKDGTVIASFTARRQRTMSVISTCDALKSCAKRIATDISKWLKKPTMGARLGSA